MDNLEIQIMNFVNTIVNRSNGASEIKKNVISYKNFLVNTRLVSRNSEMLRWLDVVINSAKLIDSFKESDGFVDVATFVESMNIYNTRKNNVQLDNKHYGHYHESYSDACGVSRVDNSSCGSSSEEEVYSSSCGSSSYRTTSRC